MKPLLVISGRDNVGTALTRLEPHQIVSVNERTVSPRQPIPPGHKMAIVDIAAGDPVVKYGAPIGNATMAIQAGDHVHTHNLSSTRGRGDLHTARVDAS